MSIRRPVIMEGSISISVGREPQPKSQELQRMARLHPRASKGRGRKGEVFLEREGRSLGANGDMGGEVKVESFLGHLKEKSVFMLFQKQRFCKILSGQGVYALQLCLLLVGLVGFPGTLLEAASIPAGTLRDALEHQVRAARRIAPETGVHVIDLESGDTVFEINGQKKLILASNTKLFTTAAALDFFGPGHFLETRVLARGDIVGRALKGDLAVLGAGDPNISGRHHFGDTYSVFRAWAQDLRQRGVDRIEGDVVLVDGLFRGDSVHPTWPRDQLAKWYEAPVGALSFNDNCISVRVRPGRSPGQPVKAELVPDLELFELEVKATTRSGRGSGRLIVDRVPGTHRIIVRGSLGQRAEEVEAGVTVEGPVQYFAAALRQSLEEEGVEVVGRMRLAGSLPRGAWYSVSSHRSDLLTTLEVTNKRSQNFYAESLIKLLGARQCDQGDWDGGIRAVTEFLEAQGLAKEGFQLADGSGMSRGNRATPVQMTTLLRSMFFHRWGREFVRTLPYSGELESSWKKRLASPPYRGNVFAKTGTLRAVSTVSGYAKARSGRLYAFSILMNGSKNSWSARRAQDSIVRELIDRG